MAARHWEQLAIPAGFPTGSLFGRAGRNIREVRAHTGVKRIDIDTLAGTIDLWGPTAASVAAAADVYRRLFANAGGLSWLQTCIANQSALAAARCAGCVPEGIACGCGWNHQPYQSMAVMQLMPPPACPAHCLLQPPSPSSTACRLRRQPYCWGPLWSLAPALCRCRREVRRTCSTELSPHACQGLGMFSPAPLMRRPCPSSAHSCTASPHRADEAAAATDKRKQLYALAPAPPAARPARLAAAQRPAALDATVPLPAFVLESDGADVVAARLARAVHAAMAADPPYHAVKLKSTLGKQLHGGGGSRGGIGSPAALGALSLADLQVRLISAVPKSCKPGSLRIQSAVGSSSEAASRSAPAQSEGGTHSRRSPFLVHFPAAPTSQELCLGYQKDLQSVFSTAVPLAKVSAMTARLREVSKTCR